MSTMPISPDDVKSLPYSVDNRHQKQSIPFHDFASICDTTLQSNPFSTKITFCNQTNNKISLTLQERKLTFSNKAHELFSPEQKPFQSQNFSLNPLEQKVVTIFFETLQLKPDALPDYPFRFFHPQSKELHVHCASNGYIDSISSVYLNPTPKEGLVNLFESYLQFYSPEKFISAEPDFK